MKRTWSENRLLWLCVGCVLGLVASLYWPTEPAMGAYAAAHGDKFSMCTVTTIAGNADAVFVLDQATGRLLGAVPSRQGGGIAATFARSLAADFRVTENAEYVMIPSTIAPTQTGSVPPADGGVWVAEQKSGLAILYLFPTSTGQNDLVPFARFPWRSGR